MTTNSPKDDIETQQLTQEQQNFIQHFEKIYFSNYKKISSLETSIRYLQIISIFAGLIFLIFFATVLVIDKHVLYTYVYSSIPFIIGIISLTLAINFFLSLTVIYNEGTSLASWMSYFSVNLAAINFIVFIILFTLKIEGLISFQWKLITIPLYVIIGIGLFYFIFMMPAFIDKESYWDIALLSNLILNTLVFMILLNSRLDNSDRLDYSMIFIPIWIIFTVNFVYLIYSFINVKNVDEKGGENPNRSLECFNTSINFMVNVLLMIASILIALNLDKIYLTPYIVSYCLIILGYALFFTERLLSQFNVNIFETKE